MSVIRKIWHIEQRDEAEIARLSRAAGVSPLTARLLLNRGITTREAAQEFLQPAAWQQLADPYALKNMGKSVARIAAAIERHEKIVIYGDYDVDGITSTAILYKALRFYQADVHYYIPEREEGYGLNQQALSLLRDEGAQLLVTVDCGISAVTEVAAFHGVMDIIITDHHEPPAVLPSAYAIINPKQPACRYPEKQLAGVGVAFKLVQALAVHFGYGDPREYIDLAAIGTIADIVSLTGENRALVKLGLTQLAQTTHLGLAVLLDVCSIKTNAIDPEKIGFVIGPRLNAAGRMASPRQALRLLLSENADEAREIATALDALNKERQLLEQQILVAAEQQIGVDPGPVIVVQGPWQHGVIGIVASRLVEKFYRPVVIISTLAENGRGSCRSIPGFNMYEALTACQEVLLGFGGHSQAAGLSIVLDQIPTLAARLAQYAKHCLAPDDYIPIVTVDAVIAVDQIQPQIVAELTALAPFGMGNPAPVLACRHITVDQVVTMGQQQQHLKLRVSSETACTTIVAWKQGEQAEQFPKGSRINVAFYPEINVWQGQQRMQCRAFHICLAETAALPVTTKHEALLKRYIPNRDVIEQVYLVLRHNLREAAAKVDRVLYQPQPLLAAITKTYGTQLEEQALTASITILQELELLQIRQEGEARFLIWPATAPPKRTLVMSETYRLCCQAWQQAAQRDGLAPADCETIWSELTGGL